MIEVAVIFILIALVLVSQHQLATVRREVRYLRYELEQSKRNDTPHDPKTGRFTSERD